MPTQNPNQDQETSKQNSSADIETGKRAGGPSKGGSGVPDDSKINQGLKSDDMTFDGEEMDAEEDIQETDKDLGRNSKNH